MWMASPLLGCKGPCAPAPCHNKDMTHQQCSYLSPHARVFILCFITRGNHTPGSRRNAGCDPPQRKPSIAAIPNQRTCHAATTLSRSPAMVTKGKTRHHPQPRPHGELQPASTSERQRSRPCGHNPCGAFVRLHWHPTSKRAIEQRRPTA